MYPEHAAVTLKSELKYQGKVLPAGTVGAIISVHSDHAVYTVEFIAEGESLLPELSHTDIEPAAERSRHG